MNSNDANSNRPGAADPDEELQQLLADFLDGELDATSRRDLNDRLRDDSQARRFYLDLCETHAALAWEHGMIVADVAPTIPLKPSLPKRFSVAATMGALVAAVLIAFSLWIVLDGKSSLPSGPVVAKVSSRIDAVVTAGGEVWEPNEIRVGGYELERGLIRLEFASGVSVLLEAPAEFEAQAEDRLILHSGRLSASVPPEGVGFTVETPQAKVVDFGTEFSVEAGAGQSEVHVFEGHVRVHPKDARSKNLDAVDLRTSQALRIAEATGRPADIDLATDRFIRGVEEPKLTYPQLVLSLQPKAYYRMPIRAQGLVCVPPKHSGEVLTGEGRRPPWAPGRFGASLRVGGRSVGRGARLQRPPEHNTGVLTPPARISRYSPPTR
ncbi:MAG: FecR family protein, partial [Planctomycetales bacterium]